MNRPRLFLVLTCIALAGCTADTTVEGTVERAVDGDTVAVVLGNGSVWTVRLIGVDTPEVHVAVDPGQYGFPATGDVETCLRAVGENASRFMRQTVTGERVRLAFDPAVGRRGDYGRVLAYLYREGTLVNRVLVERGLASVYPSTFRYRTMFERLERQAVRGKKGVWGCG